MKLLLYCTKGKPYLLREDLSEDLIFIGTNKDELVGNSLNGKIIAECDYGMEEIYLEEYDDYNDYIYSKTYYETKTLQEDDLCKQSCLTADELDDYLKSENGYAIHIKNLRIFDKPKELNEFYKFVGIDDKDIYNYKSIEKAPQNMMNAVEHLGEPMYVENHYIGLDDYFENYVLISIRPEWLCKILNGEKTIEVRKKVLKEM